MEIIKRAGMEGEAVSKWPEASKAKKERKGERSAWRAENRRR